MNYKSIKKNIRKIGLMFLSAGLLLFLSCGSDDTKDVSGEDGGCKFESVFTSTA